MDDLVEKRRQYEAERALAAPSAHLTLVESIADRAPHYLSAILDSVGIGVLLVEGDNRQLVLANQTLADLVSMSIDNILAKTRKDFVQHLASLSSDPQRVSTLLLRIPKRGPYTAQCRFDLNHPKRRVIQWEARPVKLPSGTGQLCIYRDVTLEVEATEALQRLADTDTLTGLANRRRALEILEEERERADRVGSPLCVMLFDVDHFKRINDTYGHQTGDDVLRGVARAFVRCARKTDLSARWGGEEFLLVLPDCPREGAAPVAQRIRDVVSSESAQGVAQPISLSGGVSFYRDRESVESLLRRADELLYRAKNKGRNRVEVDAHIK